MIHQVSNEKVANYSEFQGWFYSVRATHTPKKPSMDTQVKDTQVKDTQRVKERKKQRKKEQIQGM